MMSSFFMSLAVVLVSVVVAHAAALTSTNVEPASLVVGASSTVTVSFTTAGAIPNNGKIKVTFGANFNVAGATGGTCSTMDGTFATSVAGQVVTITRQADGTSETAAAETCTIGSIVNPGYAGSTGTYTIQTTDSSDVEIDIDAAVAADTIVAADAAASVVLASPTVGAAGNTTLTLTLPVALDLDDTVEITFPAHMNVASVAFASETFAGAGTFSGCAASSQVVTCTAGGAITAGTGDIVMTGITASYASSDDVTSVEVEDEGTAANDIATDTSVALTDSTADALTATDVEPETRSKNDTGTADVSFTTSNPIPSDGKIKVTFGAGFDLSSVGASDGACSTMDGAFATAVSGQTVTITRSGGTNESAGAQACTIVDVKNPGSSGSTGTYEILTTTSSDAEIEADTAVSADTITSGGGGGSAAPTYLIMVSKPNGGETLTAGATAEITWSSNAPSIYGVTISLSTNGGASYSQIAALATNYGQYVWTIPSMPTTTTARIRVELVYVSVLSTDVSDANFTINGTTPASPPSEQSSEGEPAADPTSSGPYSPSVATAAATSIAVDLGIKPVAPDVAVYCEAGSLIKSPLSSAVYYCGADGKRYIFTSESVYYSWYADFSAVRTISAEDLAKIMIGGNVTIRPGVRMIKITSDPKVYAISRGGLLRWITTEEIARALYGADWNKQVTDVVDSFFFNYRIGEPITVVE